jgi:hypothetical protein
VSLVVLLILAIVWAVFLVPQIVRHRAEKTPADSVGAFRNQLSVLERAAPVVGGARRPAPSVSVARATRSQARRRRQLIVVRLLGAMALTLLVGLLVRPVLYLHVMLDVLFLAYCALLWRAQALVAERDTKVRYLPNAASAHQQPAPFLLQQSGS